MYLRSPTSPHHTSKLFSRNIDNFRDNIIISYESYSHVSQRSKVLTRTPFLRVIRRSALCVSRTCIVRVKYRYSIPVCRKTRQMSLWHSPRRSRTNKWSRRTTVGRLQRSSADNWKTFVNKLFVDSFSAFVNRRILLTWTIDDYSISRFQKRTHGKLVRRGRNIKIAPRDNVISRYCCWKSNVKLITTAAFDPSRGLALVRSGTTIVYYLNRKRRFLERRRNSRYRLYVRTSRLN